MTTQSEFGIEETGKDEYRVPGASAEVLEEALELLAAARKLRAEVADIRRPDLTRAMSSIGIGILPHASVQQAERLVNLREQLLVSEDHIAYDQLNELRGDPSLAATRMWISRARERNAVLSIESQRRTIFPTFQFDEYGDTRGEVVDVLDALKDAGFGPWQTWSWFIGQNPWLDGARPIDLVSSETRTVVEAARSDAGTRAT